jgi:serine/threonine protein kinase
MLSPSARLRALAEQRVGTVLRKGKYSLDALIGVGSMGAVYRATRRNGGQVAVKMLHTEYVGDDAIHERFLREGAIVNQVSHPGIVQVLDDDVDDDGATFLVLELLEGGTLEDEREANGGKVAPLRLLQVVRDLLSILAAVHEKGIVHRDVKPENVFITTTGHVKLLDLGIARVGGSRLTVAGQTLGSPAYMSPEQASGRTEEVDARSDIFGVGAILFTLLTGHPVHEGANPLARLTLAATEPARSMSTVWPDAKGALVNLVDVALRFDKAQRWSSAADMSRALEAVLDLIKPSPSTFPLPYKPTPEDPATATASRPEDTMVGWPEPWSTKR